MTNTAIKETASDEPVVEEVEINIFKAYDDATLAVECPLCRAAATGKCIIFEGAQAVTTETPHKERVLASHDMTEDEAALYIAEHEVTDLEAEQAAYDKKIEDANQKLADTQAAIEAKESAEAEPRKKLTKKAS
jgi:hypothetical protein